MKILMITSYYLPYLAGAELYVKEIAERLVRDGNKVAVLTKRLGNLKKFEEINGVKVYRVKSINMPQLRSLFSIPGLFFKGKKLAKEADVIHSHITYPNGIVAHFIGKHIKKDYIVTLQGDELMDYPEKKLLKFLKWPIGQALRNAKYVHCISNALAENAVNYFKVDRNKIKVIPNGVDLDKFRKAKKIEINKDEKTIISVSRLTEKNNISKILEAMRYVRKDAKLVILGDGPEREKLTKIKEELKINVEFLGNVEHDKVASYLKAANVFIRTPVTEGLGIVFLEAMAAGLPVIASDVGGIKDIVKHNENGIIVSNKDAKEIANAINKLLDDKILSRRVSSNGKKFVKIYDWSNVYKDTIKMY